MSVAECPVCEREFEDPQNRPTDVPGSAEQRRNLHLSNSRDDAHREYREAMSPDPEFSTDEAPRPRQTAKKAAPKAKAPPKSSGMPNVRAQLEMPYHLGAALANSRGFVHLAGVLQAQAGPCAQAWDEFLKRYPKLREKIESGMVAADIVNLVMVHAPILAIAREEIAARQRAQEHYEGGLETRPAAA